MPCGIYAFVSIIVGYSAKLKTIPVQILQDQNLQLYVAPTKTLRILKVILASVYVKKLGK
jgi:hypothetical protein